MWPLPARDCRDARRFAITEEIRLASLARLKEIDAAERIEDSALENSEGVTPAGQRL